MGVLQYISVSPQGGRFTDSVTVTITASEPSTIYYEAWPNGWQHTATGQTSVEVEITQSGPLNAFCVRDSFNDISWPLSYSFIIEKITGLKSVYDRLGRVEHGPYGTTLSDSPTGDWGEATGFYPLEIFTAGQVPYDNLSIGTDLTSTSVANFNDYVGAGYPPGSPGFAISRWIGDTFSPNQYVSTSIPVPFDGLEQNIGVRVSENGDGYFLYAEQTSSGESSRKLRLKKRSGGVQYDLTTFHASLYYNEVDCTSWEWMEVSGSDPVTIKVYIRIPHSYAMKYVTPESPGTDVYVQDGKSIDLSLRPWARIGNAWVQVGDDWEWYAQCKQDITGCGLETAEFSLYTEPVNPVRYSFATSRYVTYNIKTPGTDDLHVVLCGEFVDDGTIGGAPLLTGQPAIGTGAGSFGHSQFYAGELPDTTSPVTTIYPLPGTYSSEQSVELTANETATIYYTIDGTEPEIP